MTTIRVSIHSQQGGGRLSAEFSGDHTLYEVNDLIQREFGLDPYEHLWAFYLSGDGFDRDTEFGIGREARSPDVRLADLSLTPKMRLAYLYDFGDELRHDVIVESISPSSPGGSGGVRVVERALTPPPAELELDEDDDFGDDEDEENDGSGAGSPFSTSSSPLRGGCCFATTRSASALPSGSPRCRRPRSAASPGRCSPPVPPRRGSPS